MIESGDKGLNAVNGLSLQVIMVETKQPKEANHARVNYFIVIVVTGWILNFLSSTNKRDRNRSFSYALWNNHRESTRYNTFDISASLL